MEVDEVGGFVQIQKQKIPDVSWMNEDKTITDCVAAGGYSGGACLSGPAHTIPEGRVLLTATMPMVTCRVVAVILRRSRRTAGDPHRCRPSTVRLIPFVDSVGRQTTSSGDRTPVVAVLCWCAMTPLGH